MDAGILPVKRLDSAKERLATHFDEGERRSIAEALMKDAFDLCTSVDFLTWWVVSDDESVLREARERGFTPVEDPGTGLNDAVVVAVKAAVREGADSVTVIPSDAPLTFRGDLVDLLDTGATSDVVVVPSERDGGTNGLYMSPPDVLRPSFGHGSLRKHLAAAEQAGHRCALLSLPRLSLDLDTAEDVKDFLRRPKHAPSHTASVLEGLRLKVSD